MTKSKLPSSKDGLKWILQLVLSKLMNFLLFDVNMGWQCSM